MRYLLLFSFISYAQTLSWTVDYQSFKKELRFLREISKDLSLSPQEMAQQQKLINEFQRMSTKSQQCDSKSIDSDLLRRCEPFYKKEMPSLSIAAHAFVVKTYGQRLRNAGNIKDPRKFVETCATVFKIFANPFVSQTHAYTPRLEYVLEPYSRSQDQIQYSANLIGNSQFIKQADAYSEIWKQQCQGSTNSYFWEVVRDEIQDYFDMLPNHHIMDQYGPNGLVGRLYVGQQALSETRMLDPEQSLVQVENGERMALHLHHFGSEGSFLIPKGSFEQKHWIWKIETNSSWMTDPRDGQQYRIIRKSNLLWMAENLRYSTDESFCPQNEDPLCSKFGRFYLRKENQNVCPPGWSLPTYEQMQSVNNGLDDYTRVLALEENGMDLYGFTIKGTPRGSYMERNEQVEFENRKEYAFWVQKDKPGLITIDHGRMFSFLNMRTTEWTSNDRLLPIRCVRAVGGIE